MSDQPVGTMTRDGSEYSLLLEREYPLAIESVWSALVEPEKLARWLGNVRHDARVGGSFEIDFGKGDEAGGRILVYDPPRCLAFEWGERGEPSVVRFELEPGGRGTLLRLKHTRQSAEMAAGTGPGWHAHLDVLTIVLEGGSFDLETGYRGLYQAAKARYAGWVPVSAPLTSDSPAACARPDRWLERPGS